MGQVTPPWRLVVRMERLRFLEPVPQVAAQAVKEVQAETRQSTGQWKVWQVLMNLVMGQVIPPWRCMLTMERLRLLVPEPQVAEHAVKAVQAVTLQSMGQPKVLQLRELDKVGQRTPPCLTSVMMERALVLEPVPQVLVHAL
jgi:hypothetical protein